jgi:hypothetical protein
VTGEAGAALAAPVISAVGAQPPLLEATRPQNVFVSETYAQRGRKLFTRSA